MQKNSLKTFAAVLLAAIMLFSVLPVGALSTSDKNRGSANTDLSKGLLNPLAGGEHIKSSDEQTIWDFLYNKIGNAYGAAGVMGNLYAESSLKPINLENAYESTLGYTDSSYTAAVDNGTYTNFVYDEAGYGLAQWTYYSRKQALLNKARSSGTSIGNLNTQLNYLWTELTNDFSSLLTTLRNATSVTAASTAFLKQFENPADSGSSVQALRAQYCQTYYDRYAGSGIDQTTINNRINFINDNINYFTVNGSACTSGGGHSSCSNCYNANIVTTTWFRNLFGNVSTSQFPEIYDDDGGNYANGWSCLGFAAFAEWYIIAGSNTSTNVSVNKIGTYSFTKANVTNYAQIGDVFSFHYSSNSFHYVIFISAGSSGITVLDCNWAGSTYGSCHVAIHEISYGYYDSFTISRSPAAPSGSTPSYDSTDPNNYPTPPAGTYLNVGDTGNYVKWLQACLCQLGYTCDVDGEFGSGTAAALSSFQSAYGLTVDGGFGPECRTKILALLTVATPSISLAAVTGGAKFTLSCSTSGSTIYYTTNGNTPTTSSTKYTGAFTVTSTTTVKAIAVKSCRFNSSTASKIATIYTVTFKDWDGTTLKTQKVLTGNAATAPANPTRTGYTFTGWDKAFNNVTSNLTVTAQYTINKYTVTFKDWDGAVLKTQQVNYGSSATAPTNPTRTGYTFTGWDKSFTNVTSNLTVTAQYTINTYTVVWKNYDGTTLETDVNVPHGTVPTYDGATPTRPASEQYYYTFNGWSPEVSAITDNVTYTATFVTDGEVQYIVTFVDWDGTILKTESLSYGSAAAAPADPVREGYTFTGWDNGFDNITENITVTAQYTINSYTVTYYIDGEEYSVQTVVYNEAISVPEVSIDGYTFSGWHLQNGDPVPETMPANDISVYGTTTRNTVTVTYVGVYTGTAEVPYGGNAILPVLNVEGVHYTFTVNGEPWDGTNLTEDVTVTVGMEINTYTVTFYDPIADTVLKEQVVEHGLAATAPTVPEHYGYTFGGWDADFSYVTSDLTVNAVYQPVNFTVIFMDGLDNVIEVQSVPYHTAAAAPADPEREGYTFVGWDCDFSFIEHDLVVNAMWERIYCTVTYTGLYTGEDTVEYGGSVILPVYASNTLRYTFTVNGEPWDGTNITSDVTVTVGIEIITYTVTFLDMDGTVLKVQTGIRPGQDATAPEPPVHEGYTFVDWDTDFTNVQSDLTVTAIYEQDEPLEPTLTGDVDCNGVVDMSDVSMLFSFLNGSAQLAPEGQANADVNGDGMISIMDISAIYGIIANS